MTGLQKILCKLYFKRFTVFWICLRFSIYQDFTCIRNLNVLVSQGILKGLWIYLGFSICQCSESVLETTLENNFKFKYPRETLKNKICLEYIWSETWILFLALNNIHFQRVLGKSLRNNAPPTILSNAPSWYFLQYYQRYSL